MTVRDLLNRLNKLPSLDMDVKTVTNCGKYDIWHIDLGGYIYCIEDDVQENPAELRKKLRKARKKAKRWKRKYLELRYDLDKVKSDDIINLCNQCSNKLCVFQSGIVRSHCDFYKEESEG